jgi:integrase
VRPSTYKSYKMHVESYLVPRLGTVRLQRLDADAISACCRDLLDDGKVHRAKPKAEEATDGEASAPVEPAKRGLSPMSVRHTHAVLHRALRDAVRRQRITRNPADAVDPPKVNGCDVHEMKVWTADQVKTFLEATRNDRLNPLWRLMVDRGPRRGEACGLRWDDIDFDKGSLAVRRALVPSGYVVHISEPKTSKGRRVLPLDADTISALREQARTQAADAERLDEAWTDTGYVFTGEDGQPLHPDRVTKFFDEAQKKVTVPRIRLHDLRHTCAVLHLTAAVHAKVVQELLGHSTIAVTMDTYSHELPGMQEDAAELIAALLAPTP